MKSKYKPYSSYKDSGVEWLGEIPEHWDVKKLKHIAYAKPSNIDKKSKEGEGDVLLCNYTDVYYNDFITNEIEFMKATATDEQIRKFTLHADDVIITKDSEGPEDIAIATCVKEVQDNLVCGYHLTHIRPTGCNGRYLFRAFNSNGIHDQFKISANGITRYGIGIYGIDNALFVVPPLQEQKTIANYLDSATAKIDTLIEKQTKLIALLKGKRQAVISTAVTRGLDSTVAMKDSGVEWLGEIPKHWEVVQSRRLFQERKGRMKKGDEQLTSSQKYGVIPQKKFMELEGRKVTLVLTGSEILKHVETNDFVISMRSFQGGLEYCKYTGCVSSAYVGLIPIKHVDSRFFTYLFKSKSYIQALQSTSNLVRDGQALRFDNFSQVHLVIVPDDEQKEIADYLDKTTLKIDTLITKTTKAIDLLKEKRTALISSAVTGKIDVREIA